MVNFSAGHFVSFNSRQNRKLNKLEKYLKNQIKKISILTWMGKHQLAIWDNRSMLHQGTLFNGNRIMYRITIK